MSRQSRVGNGFAEAVATFGREHGFPYMERRVTYGRNDRGDLTGTPGVTWELKATREIDLAGGMKEAMAEMAHNGDGVVVLVHKGRRKPISEAYATMPLWLAMRLLRAAGFGQPLQGMELTDLWGGATKPPPIAPRPVPPEPVEPA
jgi:hypothetical protein